MVVDFKQYEIIAEKVKALAHPQRLCIVKGLIDNTCNVTKIRECIELPQSTVSQHLAKLRSAGIIEGKREGTEISYSICDKKVVGLVRMLFDE